MPQLDILSFQTQYSWFSVFFFGLFMLTTYTFTIPVFKTLRVRNYVYILWYFLTYQLDQVQRRLKLKLMAVNCIMLFQQTHSYFILNLQTVKLVNRFKNIK